MNFGKIYVERRGVEYRWSIAHRGGPYPLLREVAKFLDVPHTSVLVHCTTVDGWTVVALTGPLSSAPEAWAIIDASADKRQIGARLAQLDQRPEDSLEHSHLGMVLVAIGVVVSLIGIVAGLQAEAWIVLWIGLVLTLISFGVSFLCP